MLREIAIADAYGAGFEFSAPEKVKQQNDLSGYIQHGLYGFSGRYTDDTQMSIALAELLMEDERWTKEKIAQKFVECFRRDMREGYSKGFYMLLSEVQSGSELIRRIRTASQRNGAAMRSVPLGFIKDKTKALQLATLQATVTHNTPVAVRSSCAVALTAHFGLHLKGELVDLEGYLSREGLGGWNLEWDGSVSAEAYETVSAALSCLIRNDNLSELLVDSVGLCGDTDSVAAISVGLACCFEQYQKDLPQVLADGLKEPLYGIEYLDVLEEKLHSKFCC